MTQRIQLVPVQDEDMREEFEDHLLAHLEGDDRFMHAVFGLTVSRVEEILSLSDNGHSIQVQVTFVIECRGQQFHRTIQTLIPHIWVHFADGKENDAECA